MDELIAAPLIPSKPENYDRSAVAKTIASRLAFLPAKSDYLQRVLSLVLDKRLQRLQLQLFAHNNTLMFLREQYDSSSDKSICVFWLWCIKLKMRKSVIS